MRAWPTWKDDGPIDWGDPPPEPPPPPSAGRSLRLAFATVYDYLGAGIAASVLAFIVYFVALSLLYAGLSRLPDPAQRPAGILVLLVVLIVAPLPLAPFTAGLFTLTRAMFHRDDPHLLDVARGARRLARPAWALAYAQTAVTTILLCDTLWLLARPQMPLKLAGILCAYATLFWGMMAMYQWPLLAATGGPWKTVLRHAFLLAAGNPFYTLALTLAWLLLLFGPLAVFFGTVWGPAVLFPVSLLWGVLLPALQTAATAEILRKYEAAAPGAEEA